MSEAARDWIWVAAWAALILLATTIPLPDTPDTGGFPADKLVHGGLYGGLGWLLGRALRRAGRWGVAGIAAALAGGLGFAALDELHQHWIPTRAPSLGDWVADAVGLTLGVAAVALAASRRAEAGNGAPREAYATPNGEGEGPGSPEGTGPGHS